MSLGVITPKWRYRASMGPWLAKQRAFQERHLHQGAPVLLALANVEARMYACPRAYFVMASTIVTMEVMKTRIATHALPRSSSSPLNSSAMAKLPVKTVPTRLHLNALAVSQTNSDVTSMNWEPSQNVSIGLALAMVHLIVTKELMRRPAVA